MARVGMFLHVYMTVWYIWRSVCVEWYGFVGHGVCCVHMEGGGVGDVLCVVQYVLQERRSSDWS